MSAVQRVPQFSPLRQQIHRLRYEVFVEEMASYQKHVDHDARTIQEPLDETGHLYAAVVDGKVVGTLRWNASDESDLQERFERYGIDPNEFNNVAITAKLVVAADYRGRSVAFRLVTAALADALNHGICFNFIGCERSLVGFYERLGYKVYGQIRYRYPESGSGVVMVLNLHDKDHLRRVRSPSPQPLLARTARQAGAVAA